MTEELKKAFDFAADATRQLITVATGVITVTVLFSKDLGAASRNWALGAWVVLTISVVFGLFVLMNLSGNLQNAESSGSAASINGPGIKLLAKIQCGLFLLGIVLVIAFGVVAANSKPIEGSKTAAQPVVNNVVTQEAAPPAKQEPEKGTTSVHRRVRRCTCNRARATAGSKASAVAK